MNCLVRYEVERAPSPAAFASDCCFGIELARATANGFAITASQRRRAGAPAPHKDRLGQLEHYLPEILALEQQAIRI